MSCLPSSVWVTSVLLSDKDTRQGPSRLVILDHVRSHMEIHAHMWPHIHIQMSHAHSRCTRPHRPLPCAHMNTPVCTCRHLCTRTHSHTDTHTEACTLTHAHTYTLSRSHVYTVMSTSILTRRELDYPVLGQQKTRRGLRSWRTPQGTSASPC